MGGYEHTSIPITLARGDHLLHSQLSKLNLKIELRNQQMTFEHGWKFSSDFILLIPLIISSCKNNMVVRPLSELCIGSCHWLYFHSTNQWRAYQLYNVVIGTPNICARILHHLILINTLILVHVSGMNFVCFCFFPRIELYSELKRLYIVNSLKVCPNWKKLLYDYNGYLFLE